MTFNTKARAIAQHYINGLIERLWPKQMDQIRSGAAVPADFCDDNIVMMEAFAAAGVDFTLGADIDEDATEADVERSMAFWNEAYSLALRWLKA